MELCRGHGEEEVVEPVLPLIAVRDGRELERRAVEQDELLVGQSIDLLDLVAQLNVLGDGLVKVSHSGRLLLPTAEEDVFLDTPDHLQAREGW